MFFIPALICRGSSIPTIIHTIIHTDVGSNVTLLWEATGSATFQPIIILNPDEEEIMKLVFGHATIPDVFQSKYDPNSRRTLRWNTNTFG